MEALARPSRLLPKACAVFHPAHYEVEHPVGTDGLSAACLIKMMIFQQSLLQRSLHVFEHSDDCTTVQRSPMRAGSLPLVITESLKHGTVQFTHQWASQKPTKS